jgi:hypothetical protein
MSGANGTPFFGGSIRLISKTLILLDGGNG